jgi:cytochrome b involved in lipid metabolism
MLVAVALLAISLSFLIYRHPPLAWRPALPAPGAKQETSQSDTPAEEEAEDEPPTPSRESPSPQTTPRAVPSGAHNGAAIPTFTLAEHESSDEDEEDNLPPPSFPAMNSAQRTSAPPAFMAPPSKPTLMAPPPTKPASSLMAPPPRIVPSNLRALPRPSQSMHVPSISTGPLPNRGPIPNRGPPVSNGSLGPPPSAAGLTLKTPNARNKVLLSPGHSPLDWADLQRSGKNLSGVSSLTRVTPSMLKHNNGRKGKPAWASYQGKVYNIGPYLPFHPGGEGELKRASGKDGGKLFMEVHPWVNWENMLGECLVGIMVAEGPPRKGSLEDMD